MGSIISEFSSPTHSFYKKEKEQMNKAKNLEDLGYLSDCFDMEKGLKHISIF